MNHPHVAPPQSFWRSRTALIVVGFLAIAGFSLAVEHTAHIFGALPYLLLLACPLLHLFMGGGHGGHGGDHTRHGGSASRPTGEGR